MEVEGRMDGGEEPWRLRERRVGKGRGMAAFMLSYIGSIGSNI
jgi:hypothetical protein